MHLFAHLCVWSACPMGCVCVSFEHSLGDCVSKCSWVPKHEFPKMHLNIYVVVFFFFLLVFSFQFYWDIIDTRTV